MLPYVVVGLAGMWAASRGKPTARVSKMKCLGTKSGLTYEVDDIPSAGVILLHYRGSTGTFERKKGGRGFKWVRGTGHPQVLAAMIRDFQ